MQAVEIVSISENYWLNGVNIWESLLKILVQILDKWFKLVKLIK